jgi:hypothetical protein
LLAPRYPLTPGHRLATGGALRGATVLDVATR